MVAKAQVDLIAKDKTKGAFKSATTALGNFRAAALRLAPVIGVGLFTQATRSAIEFADSIDKASKVAGVSAEFLQEMRFAGDQLGVSTQQVDEGFRRFTRRLGEFKNSGGGPAAKAIEQLGINVENAKGEFRGTEAIFRDFVRATANLSSEAERGAIAAQIFGDDAGPNLRVLLDQGIQGIDSLAREAADLGIILDQDLIENAAKAQDDLAKLGNVVKSQLTRALLNLKPAIVGATSALLTLSRAWNRIFGESDPIRTAEIQIDSLRQKVRDLSKELRETRSGPVRKQFLADEIRRSADEMQRLMDKLKELRQEGKQPMELLGDGGTSERTAKIGKDLDRVLDRLYPLQAEARKFAEELALIKESDMDADKKTEAIRRLADEYNKAEDSVHKTRDAFMVWKDSLIDVGRETELLQKKIQYLDEQLFAGTKTAEEHAIELERLTGAQSEYVDRLGKDLDDANEKSGELGDGAEDMGRAFEDAFESAALEGEGLSEVLTSLLRDVASVPFRQLISIPFGQAVGQGTGTTFPGFASGGSFAVGGSGGTDSQLVAFRATPGEHVKVTPAGQTPGGTVVNVINQSSGRVTTSRSNDAGGREVINVLIAEVTRDINNGGQVYQSIQNTFGMRRQGIMRT